MKKHVILTILFITSLTSLNCLAEENWNFFKDTEYCFIQSSPIQTEIPKGKTRGKNGILVYTMHKNPDLIVQITAGFNYKSVDSITVEIDDKEYLFYTDEDTAWAENDKKVLYAMKKGLEFKINEELAENFENLENLESSENFVNLASFENPEY